MKATWRKSQLRRPPRAHARYSNDREFSTRQHAGKSPSVLKGNRKRIGKKAAQSNAERSGARKACESRKGLNAQGSRTPHEAPHDKRPARKSCGAPSESRPSRKARNRNRGWPASPSPLPTSTPSRKPAPRKRSENHQISWRIARPNAVVVVSAMYENGQTLPLPSMYGKNLTFKTGGVDATGLEEPLSLIE